MRIMKMHLENFQGVKEYEIEPGGSSCSVYGDNGTGKSTIYNAFTWLMYGKPSTAEKNYRPKTAGTHNLHHAVDMTVELDDGSVMVLRKDFHEVYKTVRGNAQEVFAGHTTDYSVDGVPVTETQFKKTLADIYHNEELAKILTMFDYFLDGMSVKDRRKVLLQVCGDVDFYTVAAENPELAELTELLKKPGNTTAMYAVDEYQAIAAREKTLTDKELKDIPHRIDEAEKAKPDTSGLNENEVRENIELLQAKRDELSSQRTAGQDTAAAMVRKQIAELESQRAAGQAAHDKANAEKNKGAYERIGNLRYLVSTLETDLMRLKQDKQGHEAEVTKLTRIREKLLEEWKAEDAKQWEGNEVCPTCKRPLPPEQIEQAKAEFNTAKAQRLEEINQKGMRACSAGMIKAEQDAAAAAAAKVAAKVEELEEAKKNLEAAEQAPVDTEAYNTTEEYRSFTRQIAELNTKLTDLRATAQAANQELSRQIADIDRQIAAEQQKLAAFRFVDQQNARIEQLEEREKELAAKFEALQKGVHLCELYTRKQAAMLDEKINSRFETLRFRLFIEQQNGGIADDCEALVPCEGRVLVPFKSANNAARINAGLEVIDTLAAHYGVTMPVFVDNAESVTRIRRTNTQVIRLVVSEPDKTLRFERE